MREIAQNYTKEKVASFIEATDFCWDKTTPPLRYKIRLL